MGLKLTPPKIFKYLINGLIVTKKSLNIKIGKILLYASFLNSDAFNRFFLDVSQQWTVKKTILFREKKLLIKVYLS